MYKKYIKRPLDILCALLAMIVFWWLYLVIAILVRIWLGSPVLYRQERIGKNERTFTIYKFCTMNDIRDEAGQLLPDSERLTRLGRFLRSTSLDELPEAWNILKGDMSVIGPRPLPTLYQPFFSPHERIRHEVRGGLSGLAQVNGRNMITWEEKFAFDLAYVNNLTFYQDLTILLKTIFKALKRSDIGIRGVASSAEDFNVCRQRERKEICDRSEY